MFQVMRLKGTGLLRKSLLGAALATGTAGAVLIGASPAHAHIFTVYGHAFPTFADAEFTRLESFPTDGAGRPTFSKFLDAGPMGPGFYIVVNIGS